MIKVNAKQSENSPSDKDSPHGVHIDSVVKGHLHAPRKVHEHVPALFGCIRFDRYLITVCFELYHRRQLPGVCMDRLIPCINSGFPIDPRAFNAIH